MKLVIGADHGGFDLKENIKQYLDEQGIAYTDYGLSLIHISEPTRP